MANQTSDRQRMSSDLRALAKLAKPGSDSPVHGFDTADSSGYVDLSAYSTSDAGWVDRELARARKGAPPPPPPGGRARSIDVLTPQSMAPVSLEAFGEPEDTMNVRPSRGRRALYTLMGLSAVGAVGILAFTLAKHPPPPPQAQQTTVAAAVAAPPAADPTPPPAATGRTTTPPATVAAAPTTPDPTTAVAAVSTTTTKAKKKTIAATHAHPATPAATAAAPAHAAALSAVVIPKSAPAKGGDSLMDLIKKSVATGK
jgi:hypothetical protein